MAEGSQERCTSQDGYVDMIILCIRNLIGGGGKYGFPQQGRASLTGKYKWFSKPEFGNGGKATITLDEVKIKAGDFGSGTMQHQIYDPAFQIAIMAHEIGHYFFVRSFSGSTHLVGTGSFGLMDGDNGSRIMNGFERAKLGWVTPTVVTSNLSNIPIDDAISEGDIYKIKIGSNYYYLENRQGISYYETIWETTPGKLSAPGTGLLITESTFFDKRLKIVYADNISGTGDQDDFFNYNYKRVYSPWSTPASTNNIAIDIVNDVSGLIYVDFFVSNASNTSPSKPTNLILSGELDDPIMLSWDSNSEPNISNYKIYRKEASENNYANIATTSQTFYEDEEAVLVSGAGEGDVVYSYYIKAVNSLNKYSIASDNLDNVYGSTEAAGKIIAFDDNILDLALSFYLNDNYPNPFNPTTAITFNLSEQSKVSLKIYDISGRELVSLANGIFNSGYHKTIFNAIDITSGIYIYTLFAEGMESGKTYKDTKRMLLIK
jgi:Secretion system C-terminal sorting domain